MTNLNFNQTSASAIEVIANRVLALDPEAQQQLNQFSDKVIHLEISDLTLNYYLLFPNATVVVLTEHQTKPAASISGKLSAFIGAAANENSGDAVFSGDLSFTGDVHTIRKFQSFIQSLQIDWQQPISEIFGDVFSHNLSKAFKHFGGFIKQFVEQTRLDIPEYLQHEIQVTPSAYEINDFFSQVDQLRSHSDRLIARINRLQQSINATDKQTRAKQND
jgi:ubiquinone biosynthesis accessory factor UbiJ